MNREVNVDIDDGLGEGFRSLLRQFVPDAAGDVAMLVPADVLLGIDARVSMRCAVRVAFQRDCRTSDSWKCRDLLLQFIAPACVANFAMPGVAYKKVRSQHWTSIDIGLKPNLDNPAVEALLSIVRGQFSKKSLGSGLAGKGE